MAKSKKTGGALPSPNEIVVVDKKTFRLWCAAMMLNAKQVSTILKISLPMVYKYLDQDGSSSVRETVLLACNLISDKPSEERAAWVRTQLKAARGAGTWPAEHPVSAS